MVKRCLICGKDFTTNKSYQKYCGTDCSIAGYKKLHLDKKLQLKSLKPKTKCIVCDKEFVATKSYQKFCSNNCYQKVYNKAKRNNNPNFKISCYLRNRLYSALKGKTKASQTLDLLGCSVEELWQHLESQFQPGMTKENYGKWHVDHIKPCASFDLEDFNQQKSCFHFTNLQPLWAEENLKKSDCI